MNAAEVLKDLKTLGNEDYKDLLMRNHGVKEPCYGVKIGDLKQIQKRVKKNHELALALYETGNYDAMYLAGLIADDQRMTQSDLSRWVEGAYGGALFGTTVPSVAAGSPHGHAMATRWIRSSSPSIASAGWATLAMLVSVKPDSELNVAEIEALLRQAKEEIHQAPDKVRYSMNNFVICAGCYIESLTDLAIQIGDEIGVVHADLGNNSCKIPFAPDYIRKVQSRGAAGRKRKSGKC